MESLLKTYGINLNQIPEALFIQKCMFFRKCQIRSCEFWHGSTESEVGKILARLKVMSTMADKQLFLFFFVCVCVCVKICKEI